MLQNFNKWLGGTDEASERRLREISIEYQESEIVAATQNFHVSRRLGEGNYATVYRGTLKDGHDVAIKTFELDEDEDTANGFVDEVLVLSKFRHPNLVTLMGWGIGDGRQYLVYEMLSGGDVAKRLQTCRDAGGEAFVWAERLWVAVDASCGLSHMHNSTPRAFHRDIKSANILLDHSGCAKMADFGLSGIAKNKGKLNMTCEQISGTPGYACPHYIKSGKVTEGTEVYAFGMVLLELLLNSMPACLGGNGAIIYPIQQVVMPQAAGALDRALQAMDPTAGWPPMLGRDLAELALACSNIDEGRRPNFSDVSRHLRMQSDQFCGSKRAHGGPGGGKGGSPGVGNATQPQMGSPGVGNPTQPQMGGYPGVGQPTQPQMGYGGQPPGPGMEAPTRPQMGQGPGASPPTRPQMGMGHGPGSEVATNPQMGHMGSGHGPGAGNPTRPQMGGGLGAIPEGAVAPGTDPRSHSQQSPNPAHSNQPGRARAFIDAMKELWDHGMGSSTEGQAAASGQSPADVAEVVLECVYSSGVDVNSMPLKHKCLVLRAGESPWTIGRQQQPMFFARLVPDETTRAAISRNQMLLTWEDPQMKFKKLTPNTVLVNNQPAPQQGDIPVGHGAQIGFIGRDNQTQFLAFSVLLRDASTVSQAGPTPLPTKPDMPVVGQSQHMPQQQQQLPLQQQQRQMPVTAAALGGSAPPSQQGLGGQASSQAAAPSAAWWFAGPPTQFNLVCTSALGCDINAKPWQMRTIGVPLDCKLTVGRIHQPGFFEGILAGGPAQRYLGCISRSHLEIVPAPGEAPGIFEVINMSANPVVLPGGRRISKGERGRIRLGESIDFIGGNAASGGDAVVYMKLTPQRQYGDPSSQAASPAPAAGAPPLQPPHHHQVNSSTHQQQPSQQQQQQQQSYHLPATQRTPIEAPASSWLPQPETVAVAQHERRPREPRFTLTLTGSAVERSFPRDKRVLTGGEAGITVGRAHQKDLHTEAFDAELRSYLSRDHFRIEKGSDGSYRLVPISSNPIWRVRDGALVEAIIGEPALPLATGDNIQLFTGAEDCTPDGPGNLGTLIWEFVDSSEQGGRRGGHW